MAEFVQQSIEEMLPELEQMERVELFSGAETRTILKKRKAFEYRLRRRTKHKEDFLQYIQYEIGVLALVKKRRERIGYHHKQVEIDVAIVQRLHKLFKLACFRFQGDVKLWLSYIEFCKMKKEKASVSKMYTKMLQVHNRKPDLWVSAAKYELEDCNSMENGRQLLQRGLRFNPKSKQLWREYFRMELLNAEKLWKRREILGVAGVKNDEDIPDAVLQGKVALIVYKNAIQSIEDDVEFVLSVLPVCRLFPFTQEIEQEIFQDIQKLHGNKELTWDALARQNLHKITLLKKQKDVTKQKIARESESLEQECFQVYEKAVSTLCTEKMYDFYLKACLERLQMKKSSPKEVQQRTERSLHVFEEAATCHCLSANMALEWLTVLEKTGQVDTLKECVKHVTTLHPTSVALWKARLSYMVLQQMSYQEVYAAFKQAIAIVNAKESLPLWQYMYEWLILMYPQQVETFLESGLSQCSEVCVRVKEWYLDVTALQDITKTRNIYNRLSIMQPLSLNFFQKYVHFENSQLNVKMKKIRSAFEDAVREFGKSSPELWLNYIKMEMEHPDGQAENAGKLHWRAMKTLEADISEQFITQYTLMQNQQL